MNSNKVLRYGSWFGLVLNVAMFYMLYVVFSRLVDHARAENLFIAFCATALLAALSVAHTTINSIKGIFGLEVWAAVNLSVNPFKAVGHLIWHWIGVLNSKIDYAFPRPVRKV